MKYVVTFIALGISTLFLLFLFAAFDCSIVENSDQLRELKKGFPLKYFSVDMGRYDPPYPWKHCGIGSPLEDGQKILKFPFAVSFALVFIAQYLMTRLLLGKVEENGTEP